jgi:hypothetical protein
MLKKSVSLPPKNLIKTDYLKLINFNSIIYAKRIFTFLRCYWHCSCQSTVQVYDEDNNFKISIK